MGIHLARAARRWLLGTLKGDEDLARNGQAYTLRLVGGAIAGWRGAGVSGPSTPIMVDRGT